MRKTRTYFYTLIAITIIVCLGFLLNIQLIQSLSRSAFHSALTPWLAATAAICAFIFLNNKHYWLIMLGSSIICALFFHFISAGMNSLSVLGLLGRTLGFLSIVYLLNYIRLIFRK